MKSQSWPKEFTDLDELSNCYNSTLSSLPYNYAPLKLTVLCRKHSPWFNHIMEKLRKQLHVEEWLKEGGIFQNLKLICEPLSKLETILPG